MPDDELTTAIKNALARGENIEKAKKSLLNAGYSSSEVEIAANQEMQAGKTGISGVIPAGGSMKTTPFAQAPSSAQSPRQETSNSTGKLADKKKLILIILLSAIALSIGTFLLIKFAF